WRSDPFRRGLEYFVDVGVHDALLLPSHTSAHDLARERTAYERAAAVGEPPERGAAGDHALGADLGQDSNRSR
ncbi:MAG TPA: hypothetical protein VGI86_11725, partial [Acidimicrobiia bacterium]